MMNKLLSLGLSIVLLVSCTSKTPITEKLTLEKSAEYVGKDELYAEIIQKVNEIRPEFEKDLKLYAKVKNITYEDIYEYGKLIEDSIFHLKCYELAYNQDSLETIPLLEKYKKECDEKLVEYTEIYHKNDPTQFFKGRFLEKTETTYPNNAIRNLFLHFEITPTKDYVDQGSFEVFFNKKVEDDKIPLIGTPRYTFYKKITGPTKISRQAGLGVEQDLAHKDTQWLNDHYTIEIRPFIAVYDDQKYQITSSLIPNSFVRLIENPKKLNWQDYKDMIRELYKPNLKYTWDHVNEIMDEKLREFNPQVHSLFQTL